MNVCYSINEGFWWRLKQIWQRETNLGVCVCVCVCVWVDGGWGWWCVCVTQVILMISPQKNVQNTPLPHSNAHPISSSLPPPTTPPSHPPTRNPSQRST